MRTSRTIEFNQLNDKSGTEKRNGAKLTIPMYSGFFSSLSDNVMCTNAMFAALLREIEESLALYDAREQVTLTVYESSSSDDSVRESVIVGFRKYLQACVHKKKTTHKSHIITFSSLFAVGVLIEFLLYGALPDVLPPWIQNITDIVAWVFVWQFAAYMAFEFFRERQYIKRLEQIVHIEFVFRHWE